MSFFNKLKWILGILMIFGIIAATNLIDKNHFVRLKGSVETIYEDRLMAKGYIFEMMAELSDKEVAIAAGDTSYFSTHNESVNLKIEDLIDRFSQTRLTEKEARVLEDLRDNFDQLQKLENAFAKSGYSANPKLIERLDLIEEDLRILSGIQLEEGKKELMISKRAADYVELFTQIEIYVLIVLAVIIQIIVMYNPKRR